MICRDAEEPPSSPPGRPRYGRRRGPHSARAKRLWRNPPGQLKILRNLGEGRARPSDLAAHANVTRQAVTKVVDELERLGIVRRDPDPADGRGVIVRYTDRGLAGLDIARQRMLELEDDYAARIGAARWAEARTILETVFGDEPASS